ncbi:L,D-transpeptidase family protein [Algoriphagus chordae]|uniref:Murein L,D-transpeptidase YcbB/YkuD n=1 Tax=Algoriphagus chordae TaxID=237019 RepID=A0A2W7RM83_9BACT|nr:L,D-transpeptidase family protein [Algoriphagus chordae]PZX55629.1 murein L,D-transpeptidase YcbB/YkuD [Algoriphagus chordae]
MKNKQFLYFLILFLAGSTVEAFTIDTTKTSELIRFRIETDSPGEKINIRGTSLLTTDEIVNFYTSRYFEEVWSRDGVLSELAYEMRFEIKQTQFDGLNPKDYNLDMIELLFSKFEANKLAKEANDPGDLADVDMLLSDAFFYLASHLERGKVDPSKIDEEWEISRKDQLVNYQDLLLEAINKREIRQSLESLYPKFSIYKKGREVLRALVEVEAEDTLNWKKINVSKALRAGDQDSSIPILRSRLQYWGFLETYELEQPKLYDSTMMIGVKSFQAAHGMDNDGIIGKMTAAAMNDSPSRKVEKARVNMERLRWLPDTVKKAEFILVNIANYQLDYLKNLDTLLTERVIVGRKYHESPIFMAEMSYIVFSPYWNIPYSITHAEVIPSARKNPNYIASRNMEVVTSSGKVVNPASIDWNAKSFPYMVRQKPGPHNSLGEVKFMFPNKHNVYIHDTNARSLFESDDRSRSHGCIRIQNPQDFAKALLRDDPSWTMDRIESAMGQDHEQVVKLDKPIPVVLVYLTFWADSNGQGHFREDIYDRDVSVLVALNK